MVNSALGLEAHLKRSYRLVRAWQKLVLPIDRWRARRARARFVGTYIGITGSCGKSTTTHLLAAMLAHYGSTVAGRIYNQPQAVYRTLRKLSRPVDYLVQEISGHMGKDGLLALARNVGVDIAVVTAVGREHAKTLGSDEAAIAEVKSQLVVALPTAGIACLNADDPHVRQMANMAPGRIVLFGRAAEADIRAEQVSARWPERLGFELVVGARRYGVRTRFVGTLMLPNVLAALSVIEALGLPLEPAVAALAVVEPVYGHMSVHDTGGHSFVLDTNKAPYWSTLMLADDLAVLRGERTVLVLSQLSETGGNSSAKYRRLIRQAAINVDELVAVGAAGHQAIKLRNSGEVKNISCFANLAAAARHIAAMPPSLVVVKSAGIDRAERIFHAMEGEVACARPTCSLRHACRECPLLRPVKAA